MHERTTLLTLLSIAILTGCAPMAHVASDAAQSDASDPTCDPLRSPCRARLMCGLGLSCDAVRLSDGEVRDGEPAWDFDAQAYLGRYLVLTAESPVCRFGDAVGTSTESFASLDAIPTEPSLCSWASGPNLTCGLNTSPFTPECLGDGLLVRDASGRLYRLRVIEDRIDPSGTFLDIEWVALP